MTQQWFEVVVIYGSDVFEDAVWATNKQEAQVVAEWNWEGAAIAVK